ncbi:Na(+)-linked D-alanine glycine permease [Hafnia paralvei ATCC 29927]|jgi:alanine or glycine:cation symporter, AGCS family|uniref:Sodium:alanine symporter family protein n=4 Tax=Enterobacterales TaxID=91347 RepID=A0A2A2MB35_9GAMM|nr:sodium:alanine symporter family protein [Hafnia paralvei]EFV39493.1 amino acid carrier protein [Enterobacteriaceae bacterium 9_2_54FAA]MDU1193254.1 sodium:alanine symporter family protein [Enterobacteriaceae bacterium]AMH16774.1 sodium:alanine symporter family protein [Hafnia paralvei]KHS44892.1 alanine glycine permease [Hafnia paralvei]MBW2957157.1 sodium:alanine symporter family protein [Hafnia paralvei]
MEFITQLVNQVNSLLWDELLIFLLCGTGIYYTLRLGFIQIRHFKSGFKALFSGISLSGAKADKQGMSSFQAVATAIAGQVGTGNLAGPATAIIAGGPGAIFWMWVSSFLGMATIYAEAMLAQKFRSKDKNGQVVGGPAYYIEKGLNCKWLACIFSVLVIIALGFIGNMVQSNSIAAAFNSSLGVPGWVIGIILALITGVVIMGGISSIASFTEKVVPIKAVFYLLGTLVILVHNAHYILPAFKSIFVAAFNPTAVLGGGAGIAIQQAMRFGIARGLFSNEAGMGSTPHAHAVAKVERPEQQGYIAMMGVFVVCVIVTLTALAIITSGMSMWELDGKTQANFLGVFTGQGIAVTQQAYTYVYGYFGSLFISVSLFFFAFSTIVGWYYYGEMNIRYLFNSQRAVRAYQLMVIAFIFIASFFKVELVWNMADMFNGLMVLPNLIALILLSPIVIKMSKLVGGKVAVNPD